VGKAWAVPRQQVYRALDQLEASDMAIAGIRQPGTRGPGRTPYEVTTPGTRAVEVWLDEPVVHLRDARTLMLAKLLIRDRLALAREPFIDSQLAIFTQLAEALRARHMTEPTDLVARWRAEMALGVREATRRLR
jgi:DNA-binding PadR family transcriptional regulator